MKNNAMEMFKSKGIILFIIMMLSITYINSLGIEKMNKQNIDQKEIVLNK